MPKLDTLEERYREAQEAFREERTDANHSKYRKAKQAFALARVEERREEEADPGQPRGQVFAAVDDQNTGGNE
jgi:hypothetical protein